MSISDIAIRRPVFTIVVNVLIVVAGAIAATLLPVHQYPNVTAPAIVVSTVYQGANPLTVEGTVTRPLEQALNRVPNVRSITSQSSAGYSELDIQFDASAEIDVASQDVGTAIDAAIGKLPNSSNLHKPIIEKVKPTAQPIIWLTLRGKKQSLEDLSAQAEQFIRRPIERLTGVGNVTVVGERKPAIRIWLDPSKMDAYGVDVEDVVGALQRNNLRVPSGTIVSNALYFNVNVHSSLTTPEEFAALPVAHYDGHVVLLRNIARVERGAEDYGTIVRFDGEPALGIGIVPRARANALDVAAAVHAAIPGIRAHLPKGSQLGVGIDMTSFIHDSLREIVKTLGIALLCVAGIVYLFMGSIRTMLIPLVAIPVSIVGTFALMLLLGYSINTLTLFALVLAIGLVVDDAIIVMENIHRRRSLGEGPIVAALNGAREIAFAVIATTISLIAIFLPIALIAGDVGRLFREFAVTVAIAVGLSCLTALTLTAMLSSRAFGGAERTSLTGRVFRRAVAIMQAGSVRLARGAFRWRILASLSLLLALGISAVLFYDLPNNLAPIEDQGLVLATVSAPAGSNVWTTDHSTAQAERIIAADPAVADYFTSSGMAFNGPDLPSSGFIYARLKPREKRQATQMQVVDRLRSKLGHVPGADVFALNPPSLNGSALDRDLEATVTGPSYPVLDRIDRALRNWMTANPDLSGVESDLSDQTPQLDVAVRRRAAESMAVPASSIAGTLAVALGGRQVGTFDLGEQDYPVIVQLDNAYRSAPDQINHLAVRSESGFLTSLGPLINIKKSFGPAVITHHNLKRSFTLGANLNAGGSLGKEARNLAEQAKSVLPEGYAIDAAGSTRVFHETMHSIYVLFGASLLFIYLVLAAQFENWVHPFIIMLSVPFALAGALSALWVTGNSINLYSGIGTILLVGLTAKNGILLVDYANQRRVAGDDIGAAALAAVGARFRPILMTSLAMIFGSIPLALASGAGAESRQPLGWVVVGGLLVSAILTMVVSATLYVVMTNIAERLGLNTMPPAKSFIGGASPEATS